jgi:hypothetical protein
MSHLDPNDVVVAELDVVVSNQLASLATQLVMLQQPLRPNWRPYNTGVKGLKLAIWNAVAIVCWYVRL